MIICPVCRKRFEKSIEGNIPEHEHKVYDDEEPWESICPGSWGVGGYLDDPIEDTFLRKEDQDAEATRIEEEEMNN